MATVTPIQSHQNNSPPPANANSIQNGLGLTGCHGEGTTVACVRVSGSAGPRAPCPPLDLITAVVTGTRLEGGPIQTCLQVSCVRQDVELWISGCKLQPVAPQSIIRALNTRTNGGCGGEEDRRKEKKVFRPLCASKALEYVFRYYGKVCN